ncbi:MAG: hypothetical protein OHK0039_23780 [Bacteroidia bacterium]
MLLWLLPILAQAQSFVVTAGKDEIVLVVERVAGLEQLQPFVIEVLLPVKKMNKREKPMYRRLTWDFKNPEEVALTAGDDIAGFFGMTSTLADDRSVQIAYQPTGIAKLSLMRPVSRGKAVVSYRGRGRGELRVAPGSQLRIAYRDEAGRERYGYRLQVDAMGCTFGMSRDGSALNLNPIHAPRVAGSELMGERVTLRARSL